MTRALFVSADDVSNNPGGYGIYSRQLFHALQAHFDVTAVRLDAGGSEEHVGASIITRMRQIAGMGDHQGNGFAEQRRREARYAAAVAAHRPDVVFLNHLRAACIAPPWGATPLVYVAHNAESRLATAWWQARRAARVHTLEAGAVRRSAAVVALTGEDLRYFGIEGGDGFVVPPCVDPLIHARAHSDPKLLVVYSGSFHWHEKRTNAEWLLDAVMPSVWRRLPQAELVLLGAGSHRIRARDRRVRRLGFDDAPAVWPHAGVAVAPERQRGGLKLKVLEAAGSGVPLVATSSAVEGTGLWDGTHVAVADDAPATIRGVLEALHEPDRVAVRAQAAEALVVKRFGSSRFRARVAELVGALKERA